MTSMEISDPVGIYRHVFLSRHQAVFVRRKCFSWRLGIPKKVHLYRIADLSSTRFSHESRLCPFSSRSLSIFYPYISCWFWWPTSLVFLAREPGSNRRIKFPDPGKRCLVPRSQAKSDKQGCGGSVSGVTYRRNHHLLWLRQFECKPKGEYQLSP